MWRSSSGEQIVCIDQLPEDTMYFYSPQSLQAEMAYRQERIKRDYQRPWWFHRKPAKPVSQTPCAPAVLARHAM